MAVHLVLGGFLHEALAFAAIYGWKEGEGCRRESVLALPVPVPQVGVVMEWR